MAASCSVILWHKVLLSTPCWFLVEVFAKQPWKWSIYSSIALTGLFPIVLLITLTLGSITVGVFTLLLVQCGLFTMAFASLISSVAVIAPVALLLTFSFYLMYKSTLFATRAVCWAVLFPANMFKYIQANVIRVDKIGFELGRNPRLCRGFDKKQQNDVSEVRPETTRRIRQTRTQRLLNSESECQNRGKVNTRQQEQGFLGCFELFDKRSPEDSTGADETRNREKHLKSSHSRKKSEGWYTWPNQVDSNSSFSDSNNLVGTFFHNYKFQSSSSQKNSAFNESTEGSSEFSLPSDEETIKLTSGSSSDSYHTAEEWIAEDYIGNVIPDYRDRESKMYDALLKRDFYHSRGTDMRY